MGFRKLSNRHYSSDCSPGNKADLLFKKIEDLGAVVATQLVERSLPNTRDPRFESRHLLIFIYQLCNRKDERKKKRPGMAHLKHIEDFFSNRFVTF